MSGLMWRLWFISCGLGILFCCSISLLQAPPTVVVPGLQPSFPDVVQYYTRRFLQEFSPPPSSFLSPTPAPSVFAPPPPPPPSLSPPAPTPVNPPSLSLPVSPTPSATPSPSSIPPPSSSPAPSTTSPVYAPAGNPPQFAPSLPVSLPSLSSPSSSFASPTPSSSPPSPISSSPPSPPPLSPSPLSTTPSSTPLSPPPTSLPPSSSPSSSSPSSPPLSLSPPSPPPSPSPSLSPPSPPPSSTPPSSPPIAPPPSFLPPPSASPPTSLPPTPTVPSTTPPPVAYSPTSPPQNSPPPATPPPTSPTNSPTSPSPPPPPPSNNVVPSPSPFPTPPPSLSPSPSVVSPSSPPFSSSSPPPPPPPNNPPPVPPPSPTPAPVSSPPTSPAPPSTPPALAPSSLVPPSSPVILSPPPQSSPVPSPSPSTGCCSTNTNTIPRPGSSNASSSCDCVNAITVELQFDNALSNATTSLFQQELAQQLNFNVQQVQVTFNGSTGSRLGLQFASQIPLIVTAAMGPLTGSSFPPNSSLRIRTAIVSHEVVFSSDFGNYTLLSLYPPLGNVLTPAPSTVNTPSSSKSNLGLIIGVAAGGGVIILIILAVIVWICCCSKRWADPESATRGPITTRVTAVLDQEVVTPNDQIILADSKSFPRPENTQQFSYEELREATNDFAPECFLGEGGFGKVYRGVLRDGTEVAIKKLTIGGHQGDREFLVEVEMLSRLHHRHLVKLLGYFCSHEPRQQLLCYELIPNGSLEAWLHGSLGVTRGPLDWATRMKIAIGAARGLAYLHEDSQPCVIHRDFKASNILLQNNFNPKVADFGLARLAPEGQGNYVSTRVMGTFGYVAPEYAMTGHLLVKSDVYSYGVVLLELLSGRKPVDLSRSEGGENITTWASPMLNNRERVFELADVRLEGKYPREDFVKVAALAAACIAREWRMRPTMGEVVQTLTAVCRSLEYDLSSDGDRGVNSAGEREGGGASTPTSSTSGGSHLGFSTQWHPTAPASTNLGSEDGSSSLFSSGPFMGTTPEPLSDHLSRTHIIPEDLHEGR